MDPVRLCSEWGCKMVREIPDAFQLHISEFNPEPDGTIPDPVVHIIRMTSPQWAALNAVVPNYLLNIERMSQREGYAYTKDEIKYLVSRSTSQAGNHEPLAESQFRRQSMSPSKWFLKFVTPCNSTDNELSVRAGQFAAAWVAVWRDIRVPEILRGQQIQDAYRSMRYMCGAGSCMAGVHCGVEKWRFTEIWTSNPERCAMAVIRSDDGEIIERCLMFLPDSEPIDTPIGRGWRHSRIYPGDTPVSRAIMGPWLVRNGMTDVRATSLHLVVSGFRFLANRYLPYMDVGDFIFDDNDAGDPVSFHVNADAEQRGGRNAYPYHYDNSTSGGPYARRMIPCYTCNCQMDVDGDDADDYREHDGRIYCMSCFDDQYSYCEINDWYYPHDEFIDVHGCCVERVWRDTNSFHARVRYGDQARQMYRRVTLVSGDDAFVPECEIVNDRWVQDMEDNGWIRMPSIRYRALSDGPSVWLNETDEADWDWQDPSDTGDHNTVDLIREDDDPLTAHFYGRLENMLIDALRRAGLGLLDDGRDQRMHVVDKDGNRYKIRPLTTPGYMMAADIPYDHLNDSHNINLFGSSITGFTFTKIETATIAENESNL
jgi:hypothetical protein